MVKSTFEHIYVEKRDSGIAFVVMNDPATKNAITGLVALEIAEALRQLDFDDEVRVVILRGEGTVFSSGGNMKQGSKTIEQGRQSQRKYGTSVLQITQMEKPVIAMVDGWAIGGGFGYVLCCDIVIASERAKFRCPFLALGIAPELGVMYLLPKLVGLQKAKEIWFTNPTMTADECKEMGIVNKVVAAEVLLEETVTFAEKLATMPLQAVCITKRIANSLYLPSLVACLDAEAQVTPFCTQTVEQKAKMEEFRNRN